MIHAVFILAGLAAVWFAGAIWSCIRDGISLRHALPLAPIKLLHRLDTTALRPVRTDTATLYVVGHQSRLEPAIMLAMLPDSALHVLDDHAATSIWMEPFRALGRTIRFNPEHIFFSRRLIRMLRGGAQLVVYLPENVDPSSRDFRLYRAVARIAHKADANVVAVHVENADRTIFALPVVHGRKLALLPPLTLKIMPPRTIAFSSWRLTRLTLCSQGLAGVCRRDS
jgi:acyl-[acyl-carrier-protein]-phospholipid O-acyltransferase / long-chain-fatty-acid--[acyl-carrier-protein] ligase